jgi:hypothetical protein
LIPVEIPATDLPFYELDEEEALVYEAADAALGPVIERPPEREKAPEPVVEALPEPQPEPEPEPQPLREAVVLYGTFDRATIAFFERIFHGTKPPSTLQHCLFGSALACSTNALGEDASGLQRHLDAQAAILHRIALHEKLGKKEPIAEYAGELLAQLDALRPAPVEAAPPSAKDRLTLASELSDPTLAVLARIAEERARWDFVKARQLTLALQAQTVVGGDDAAREALESALHKYAQLSVTVLQRLFVRIRVDRTTGLLFANEMEFDASAKAVLAALKRALA